MWNPISFVLKLFKPKVTLWTLFMSFLTPIIFTVMFFVVFTLFFRYVVRPFLHIQRFKHLTGAWLSYMPVLGLIWNFKRDEKLRGDFHYSTKKRMQEQPETRFLVAPYKSDLMIYLYDPALVKEFLSKEDSFTVRDPRRFMIRNKLAKTGLAFAKPDVWQSERKFITEVFNEDFVKNFVPTVQSTAKEWIGHNFKEEGTVDDMAKKLRWFTAKIGAKMFFGEHIHSTPAEFKSFMKASIENEQAWSKVRDNPLRYIFGTKIHKFGLRSVDRRYNRSVKTLKTWYNDMMDKFKKGLEEAKDTTESKTRTLLETILSKNSGLAADKQMSDENIIAQISTFFTAETMATSAFLTSVLFFLSTHKFIQQKLREEIIHNYGTSKSVDVETLSKMEYLDCILKETLRLQTPASILYQRKVKENTTLIDLKLKKGDRVNVDVLGMGYNPKLFENPTDFYPHRWVEKKDPGVNIPHAHIPFSAGAHKCPGEQFALMETKIVVCELIKKFDITNEGSSTPRMWFDYVYQLSDPLKLKFALV